MKIISQELRKISPEFLSVTEPTLYHTVLSNIECLGLAPILPFCVCVYFYFSRFAFLVATVARYDPAEKKEKKLALKKQLNEI